MNIKIDENIECCICGVYKDLVVEFRNKYSTGKTVFSMCDSCLTNMYKKIEPMLKAQKDNMKVVISETSKNI